MAGRRGTPSATDPVGTSLRSFAHRSRRALGRFRSPDGRGLAWCPRHRPTPERPMDRRWSRRVQPGTCSAQRFAARPSRHRRPRPHHCRRSPVPLRTRMNLVLKLQCWRCFRPRWTAELPRLLGSLSWALMVPPNAERRCSAHQSVPSCATECSSFMAVLLPTLRARVGGPRTLLPSTFPPELQDGPKSRLAVGVGAFPTATRRRAVHWGENSSMDTQVWEGCRPRPVYQLSAIDAGTVDGAAGGAQSVPEAGHPMADLSAIHGSSRWGRKIAPVCRSCRSPFDALESGARSASPSQKES